MSTIWTVQKRQVQPNFEQLHCTSETRVKLFCGVNIINVSELSLSVNETVILLNAHFITES